MSCCRSAPYEQMFKPRVAERSLARYRRHGLDALERRMVERIVVVDVLEHPESVVQADFVILNRVVCRSPDGVELTAAAARLARRGLAAFQRG